MCVPFVRNGLEYFQIGVAATCVNSTRIRHKKFREVIRAVIDDCFKYDDTSLKSILNFRGNQYKDFIWYDTWDFQGSLQMIFSRA